MVQSILHEHYRMRKKEINEKLLVFKQMGQESDEKIFVELCFCLCTPQSKAKICDIAIRSLYSNGTLISGTWEEIQQGLIGVRFAPTKAKRIVAARDLFSNNGQFVIKQYLDTSNIFELRNWLAITVKGLGYKESSHFLRNIGLGKKLAILDRHILKNLDKFGIIKEIPPTISKKKYLEIEQMMQEFCQLTGIALDELDLLFWSMETGEVFK
jgi:N-glycosylase/DNA lyase